MLAKALNPLGQLPHLQPHHSTIVELHNSEAVLAGACPFEMLGLLDLQ